jgi:hypothetical protein
VVLLYLIPKRTHLRTHCRRLLVGVAVLVVY